MSRRCLSLFLLFFACANPVSADSGPAARTGVNAAPKELDQIIYKGLIGNALDGIAMDPSDRVSLQRTNAIISSTLSGRSLATLAGLSNPVLLIGGLVWGMWAAANIKPEDDGVTAVSAAEPAGAEIPAQVGLVALLDSAPAARDASAAPAAAAASARPAPRAPADAPFHVRAPVVKIWLPQRASAMASAR